jgi:hypothetical protein
VYAEIDHKLGWRPTTNYRFQGFRKDAVEHEYFVNIRTDRNGFRMFGNLNSKKPKIMFIGDSFTHALEVSDDKTYYSILAGRLPIEVFAYGGGGYGTLQEYMILDEYIDQIKPDAIVWQYCYNDFINNSYDLELKSHINNNGMRRPYLTKDGQIFYALPGYWPFLRRIADEDSKFLYLLISRLDKLDASLATTVEEEIETKGAAHPGFRESSQITNMLVAMIRARVPPTINIYAFSVDNKSPYYEEFKRISGLNGLLFIDGIPDALHDAEEKGFVTKARDRQHWSGTGHRIAAETLLRYFETEWKNLLGGSSSEDSLHHAAHRRAVG